MARVLILGAHPDDVEFGMGATLAKLKRQKHYCFVAVLSPALQLAQNKHILSELKKSMQSYNILDGDYRVYDFRTRFFPTDSPEIQDTVFKLKKEIQPDVVYCPSPNALHPDHSTLGRCVTSVFQETSIMCFEDVRGNHKQQIDYWHEVNQSDVSKKIRALKCYKSQFTRNYFDFEKIYHLISARGLQIGVKFAEGFENLRYIEKA